MHWGKEKSDASMCRSFEKPKYWLSLELTAYSSTCINIDRWQREENKFRCYRCENTETKNKFVNTKERLRVALKKKGKAGKRLNNAKYWHKLDRETYP